MSVLHCSEQLQARYRTQRVQHPSIRFCELEHLQPSMLGALPHQKLSRNAAKTGIFAGVRQGTREHHVACLGAEGPALVAMGDALARMRDVMRQKARVVPLPALQEHVDQAKRAFVVRPLTGIRGLAKCFFFVCFFRGGGYAPRENICHLLSQTNVQCVVSQVYLHCSSTR